MKIINYTDWNTSQLRALLGPCLIEVRRREGRRRELSRQVIYVHNHKRVKRVGGFTQYHANSLTIKLPYKKVDDNSYYTHATRKHELSFSQSIADVYFHEVGHCLGVAHHDHNKTIEHLYQGFIKTNISNEKFPINQVKDQPIEVDRQELKYLAAVANLKRAQTRFKRAKTLLQKRTQKVKYYQRVMAKKKNATT